MIKSSYAYSLFSTSVFKRTAVIAVLLLFFSSPFYSQTTNIQGIVNTYHKVVEIIPAKACIRVADITNLDVNSRIMLIQMKGASISIANNSMFGDTISLNSAGSYEIGTVCYIIGDSVFLFHELLNNYNFSSGKVQLVQFGDYYSANVIDTVKAAPWDSIAGTGGVIAIFCDQDLTLNKPIYADSSGYRGGLFLLHNGNCSDGIPASTYAYNPTATTAFATGAYKGEGVANLTLAQSGGRGAPANGGGGGNNHNNSGGGGANLTAGGIGGGNSSNSVPCTFPYQGLAGKALSPANGIKIFSGGGGGAGNTNNGISSTFSYGGNGGGIVFIWANNLVGNGESISANGGKGGPSQSDGAGGGGAGGSIILNITNYTGPVSMLANGGNGGLSDNGLTNNRCFGGGGGGSGGAIYFSSNIPSGTWLANGGAAGNEIGRAGNCDAAPVPATAGGNGQIFSNYTFLRSTATAGYCRLLLPVKLLAFEATINGKAVTLDWKIDNPADVIKFIIERSVTTNQWMEVKTIPGNDLHHNYTTIDENPIPGRSYYRIKFMERNNNFFYSPVRQIIIKYNQEFIIYPNPASDKIMIAGNYNCPASMKLTDISGKLIFKTSLLNTPAIINLPYLPAGIYILRINEMVQKLVIR